MISVISPQYFMKNYDSIRMRKEDGTVQLLLYEVIKCYFRISLFNGQEQLSSFYQTGWVFCFFYFFLFKLILLLSYFTYYNDVDVTLVTSNNLKIRIQFCVVNVSLQ